MPYALERYPALGSGHRRTEKAIVVNTQTGKHYSTMPIPLEKAKAQMRLLYGVEHGMVPKEK